MSYTPSELIAALDRHGIKVTERRLTDWREKGILPPLKGVGLGRGTGTRQVWENDDVLQQAIAAEIFLSRKSRTRYALAHLWLAGFDVPVDLGKTAWLSEIAERKIVIEKLADRKAGGLEGLLSLWVKRAAERASIGTNDSRELATELGMNWLELIYHPDPEIDYWERAQLIIDKLNLSLSQQARKALETGIEYVFTALRAMSVHHLPELINEIENGELEKANLAVRTVKNISVRWLMISAPEVDFSDQVEVTLRILSDNAPALILSHVVFQKREAESLLDDSIGIIDNALNLLTESDIILSRNSHISYSDHGKYVFEQAKAELTKLWSEFGGNEDQWTKDFPKSLNQN